MIAFYRNDGAAWTSPCVGEGVRLTALLSDLAGYVEYEGKVVADILSIPTGLRLIYTDGTDKLIALSGLTPLPPDTIVLVSINGISVVLDFPDAWLNEDGSFTIPDEFIVASGTTSVTLDVVNNL